MPGRVFFRAAGPIGETDIDALPVKEIGPAVGYYTRCLGFTLVSRGQRPSPEGDGLEKG